MPTAARVGRPSMRPMTVLTRPDQADPAWLSRVLGADIAAVTVEPLGGTWSRTFRLGLDGTGPSSLVLKLVGGDHAAFDRSEVDYYTRDYLGRPDLPLVRCHHAAYRDTPRAYHLLLDDLGPTHRTAWDLDPATFAVPLATAVAGLHAARWNEPPPDDAIARYVAYARIGLAPLLELTADTLPAPDRATLVALFADLERVFTDRLSTGPLTILHGDVNPGNSLVPRDPSATLPIYLLDRQPFDHSLRTWIGAWDLAYPMVLFWDPADRRRLETTVLDTYRATLAAAGIAITAADLHRDYQLAILQCLAHATSWLTEPADRVTMRWVWETQLTRALAAVTDHARAV
jgi:hypothetical protein